MTDTASELVLQTLTCQFSSFQGQIESESPLESGFSHLMQTMIDLGVHLSANSSHHAMIRSFVRSRHYTQ